MQSLAAVSNNRNEDQVKFLRLLPELRYFVAFSRNRSGNHPKPMFSLSSFLSAITDFVQEFLFAISIISLAVISTNTCARSSDLINKRPGDAVHWNGTYKIDNCLSEKSRSLLKIVIRSFIHGFKIRRFTVRIEPFRH